MDKDLVRHLRITLGATQKELAVRLGLNQSTVSRWERGTTRPDAETRRRLYALLQGASDRGEASLRLLVSHSPAAMALFDAGWRVHALSQSFSDLLGSSPGEAIGTDLRRRFSDELTEAAQAALARGLLTGGTSGLRILCPLRGGRGRVWTDGTWHALRLDGQERPLVVWQCRVVPAAEADALQARRAAVLDLGEEIAG
ncbi:helix-turn-helix domain-containing protein [Caenispirillum bisanense]|uniref:PAS domain S-box-containing protein n=1 Tax=Caenispirillum bisanense TaxID=414052 RepID=A0A286G1I4_9PROT|nr:helix-turn-helix domain-containing protein [Caenispirillum bisanense]SOD89039.1 PAS domain S-box-containing protein [Caenispirillum bisanense]